MRTLAVASVAALAAACATKPPPLTNPADVRVEVRDSAFDANVTLLGQEMRQAVPRGLLSDQITWRIRTFVGKATGTVSHQLYATIWHQDDSSRRFYTASFPGGETVRTVRINYRPSCSGRGGYISCTHDETVGADITSKQWAVALASGLAVRFNAQSGGGDVIINIPQVYATAIEEKAAAAGATKRDATPAAEAPPSPQSPATVAPPRAQASEGRDAFVAERFARTQGCSDAPRAQLSAKGAGFETYAVQCRGGDTMFIRCEMGACRALR